jgi:acyl dehydratase
MKIELVNMDKSGRKTMDLREGTELPSLVKSVVQENINRYAEAARDFNPIHIDPEFAKRTPAGGTIAHGMLALAYVSQMLTDAFGLNWVTGGKLDIRFKAPARPGDTLMVSGQVIRIENDEGRKIVRCDVNCTNQKDEVVVLGNAEVRLSDG